MMGNWFLIMIGDNLSNIESEWFIIWFINSYQWNCSSNTNPLGINKNFKLNMSLISVIIKMLSSIWQEEKSLNHLPH